MNWPNRERWMALCQSAVATSADTGWYERLTRAYGQPQRYYHNQQHIAECLDEFDQARHLAHDPVAVEFALWFHDAVYEPKASDNEEQSADLAKVCLAELGIHNNLASLVVQLILATKNHEVGAGVDAGVMIDVDLSILGRDKKRFFEYEEQIRSEYKWVPLEMFASKRAEILRRFLSRERIFATEWFRCRYEQQARLNLEASIAALSRITL